MPTTDNAPESFYIERNVVDPEGIVQVYKDRWWWCVEGDPKRALFYRRHKRDVGSPQCNGSQALAESVGANLKHAERAQLIHIPLAFVPWVG